MNFDPTWLFLSLLPSGAGFVLFVYGKKQERWVFVVGGILLTIYPYFATTVAALVGGGLLIGVGCWWATRLGW